MNTQLNNGKGNPEKNIVTKTIAAVLAAGVITALSVSGAYLLVAQIQPATTGTTTAVVNSCGESDGDDKPKAVENTCGEDKDKGGGGGSYMDV
ncbi:MAG: hypothetical protein JXX29_02130 [Deltaproteobacteria bacterium]|nr:hypothetical protein [Deltaproteobacteria bacterium]MBN2670440.1 hypothetical protein [Deltaproteobacteria bacterium]